MEFPPGLTLDEKFDFLIALAQERNDAKRKAKGAKPECRDKPVVSRTGRVVKPATVACGSVCRQKRNCKITKRQIEQVRKQMPGATNREVAEAIKKAMAKRREGMGTKGALYEGTRAARGARGNERVGKQKERVMKKNEKPKAKKREKLEKHPDDAPYKMMGRGGQAPVGGVWIENKMGDVVFYAGGQWLPDGMSSRVKMTFSKPRGKRVQTVKFTRREEDVLSKQMKELNLPLAVKEGYGFYLTATQPRWSSEISDIVPGFVTLTAIKDPRTDYLILLQVPFKDEEKIEYVKSLVSGLTEGLPVWKDGKVTRT